MVRVIIVEDEQLIREGLKFTVDWRKYGCRLVGMSSDGKAGEALILKEQPDIVITDIRMPEKSGLEMVESLQGKVKTEFIILSGYDDFIYAKQAIRLGARGYLLKPIDDTELEEILLRTVEAVKSRKNESRRIAADQIRRNEQIKNALSDKYLEKAFLIMKQRYMEDLTMRCVAEELYISESYLGKLFKHKTEHTFLDFLTLYRVKAAIELLENSDRKVYEIAGTIGYGDSKYFSKVFSKIVGIKPTEYRNGYQLAPDNLLNLIL
ncbi:MAG: response regulator [Lachnospiraceae bacterium]